MKKTFNEKPVQAKPLPSREWMRREGIKLYIDPRTGCVTSFNPKEKGDGSIAGK